jgi:hypothetical protein
VSFSRELWIEKEDFMEEPVKGYFRLFFEDPIHLKAGFATAAATLACFQVFSAAWIYGRLPWHKPSWINPTHRWSGRLAFLCTLPVAYHCIFKLGFQHPDNRVLAHSLLGCAVYGGYAARSRSCGCGDFRCPYCRWPEASCSPR